MTDYLLVQCVYYHSSCIYSAAREGERSLRFFRLLTLRHHLFLQRDVLAGPVS